MVIPKPKQPDAEINKLIEALKPLGETVDVPARKRLSWRKKDKAYVYLFIQGEISILRTTDSLLLGTVFKPHVFGLTELFAPIDFAFLRAETECTLIRLDATKALYQIERQNLWLTVSKILMYHTQMMLYRDIKIVNRPTSHIIYSYLNELNNLPESLKYRISVLRYIQERTGLSRISILNVVTSLNKKRFIEYERGGYRLKINNLPD